MGARGWADVVLSRVVYIMPQRIGDRVRPATGVDLPVDVVDMAFDRPNAQDQLVGYLPVTSACGDEAQDLRLPRRQAVRQCGCRGRR